MNADRELLELAAKAAGVHAVYEFTYLGGETQSGPCPHGLWNRDRGGYWNPLTDDGDCARMEAKAMVSIKWHPFSVVATASAHDCTELYADHGKDRAKARRYASTHAAAELAKAMP